MWRTHLQPHLSPTSTHQPHTPAKALRHLQAVLKTANAKNTSTKPRPGPPFPPTTSPSIQCQTTTPRNNLNTRLVAPLPTPLKTSNSFPLSTPAPRAHHSSHSKATGMLAQAVMASARLRRTLRRPGLARRESVAGWESRVV